MLLYTKVLKTTQYFRIILNKLQIVKEKKLKYRRSSKRHKTVNNYVGQITHIFKGQEMQECIEFDWVIGPIPIE